MAILTTPLIRMNKRMLCVQVNEHSLCFYYKQSMTFCHSYIKKNKTIKTKMNSAPPICICICCLFILSDLFIFGYIPPSQSKPLSTLQFILIHNMISFEAYLCLN